MLSATFNDQVLYLEGDLQVHHLEKIKDDLVGYAVQTEPMTVDLSLVNEVDLAGLQLVLAFLRSRKSETKLDGIGMQLDKAFSISGLKPHFVPYLIVARS